MTSLPRVKPHPIPRIHPVPEYAASGALAAVYARTKEGFGVPWMGVVAMAFAHYPRFYERLWSALAPVVGHEVFARSCQQLRERAEEAASALGPASIRAHLTDLGYDDREVDEIRACNEVFSAGNMPYVLMATLARSLLEGHAWDGNAIVGPQLTRPAPDQKPPLIEEHHADPTVAALYADIRGTLGLPFVNTDYRAFARWPSYFAPAWTELKRAVNTPHYADLVAGVHHEAHRLACGLPNPTGLTADELRSAAQTDAPTGEALDVVRLFQWLLPGLIVNVAFLRAQLDDHAFEGRCSPVAGD